MIAALKRLGVNVEKQLKESRDMNEEIEALKMIIRDL